jgi:hypothetical protein
MSDTNPYAPKEEAVAPVTAVEPEVEEKEEVPSGTVSEVLAWVDDDKDRAQAALDAEKDGAARVTLIHALEDILK